MKNLVTVITYLLLVSFIYVNCVEKTTEKYDYSVHIDRISLKDVKFPCRNDTRCIQVYNDSICANGYCWCREAPGSKPYYCNLEHVTLYPKIFGVVGRICKHDTDCGFDNGFCNTTRHQCFCNPEFTADTKRHKCLPIVKNISGACEDNTQCHAGIPNSTCHNKECVCKEGYHFVDNKCWKTAALGDSCNDTINCNNHIKNAICNNTKICDCPKNYMINSMGNDCIEMLDNYYYDNCIEDSQCIHAFDNSTCVDNYCQCNTNNTFSIITNTCLDNTAYLEPCSDDNECFFGVKSDPKAVKCINNVCNCTVNYFFFENTCSGAEILNYLSVIGMILLSISIFICT